MVSNAYRLFVAFVSFLNSVIFLLKSLALCHLCPLAGASVPCAPLSACWAAVPTVLVTHSCFRCHWTNSPAGCSSCVGRSCLPPTSLGFVCVVLPALVAVRATEARAPLPDQTPAGGTSEGVICRSPRLVFLPYVIQSAIWGVGTSPPPRSPRALCCSVSRTRVWC